MSMLNSAICIGLFASVSLGSNAVGEVTLDVKLHEFNRLIVPETKIEKIAEGFNFTEGPAWSKDGCLVFSDIPAGKIRQWEQSGKVLVINEKSGNSNGLTFDQKSRLIACEHGTRRVTRKELDGSISVLASKYNGKRLNSPNDVVVKSDGSIYFTDPPYGVRPQDRELDFQGIYKISTKGKITLLNKEMKCPNGLAFSPDEKILYVADSSERMHIKAFDVKPDGKLENGRVFAELKSSDEGAPDGMKVDVEGNVWSTGPGGIWIFDKTGALLGKILFPEVPANCAWGDEDCKMLYVTARTSLYRIHAEVKGVRISQIEDK
ncbi:MAG: SMP-30/gluconolactonase/LRE family protein [Armatimonadota bacterium]